MNNRVISNVVLDFADEIGTYDSFIMNDLRKYVSQRGYRIAPDSSGRILRNLRQTGELNYRVINRSKSLYEFVN
jgi:hypothetical protein